MTFQDFLKDAAERGEKIKARFIDELLQSRFINQLLKNKMFVEGIVSILNAKSGVEKSLHHNLNLILKMLEIPTSDTLSGMERKIHRLENEIETLNRKRVTKSLRKKSPSKTSKPRKKAKR